MILDALFIIFMIFAVYQGMSKGLIMGLFSFLAFIIGLVAAVKLSAVVAASLETHTGASKWLPVLSFIIVFVLFIILVSVVGRLIKKAVKLAMLGWLDSLLGVVLYVVLYTIIFSVFLFFAQKMNLVSADTIAKSKTYPYIYKWGPSLIDNIGSIIPVFKDMFSQLGNFFEGIGKK
jgi:membrane protein required for colicin V production